MKTFIISLFMLASISSYAMPNVPTKTEKKATSTAAVSSVESTAALSMKQLQEENMQLKQQLLSLSNEKEELIGMITYQTTMQKMLLHLDAKKQTEDKAELDAQINYNSLMSNVVRILQSTSVK